jgi:hypothetical protein
VAWRRRIGRWPGGEAGGLPPLVTMQTMFGEGLLPPDRIAQFGGSQAGGQADDSTAVRSTRS